MSTTVRMDRQGRVVIPLAERQRLGLESGATFELVATAEGLLLERRRTSVVRHHEDGLPSVRIEGGPIDNDAAVQAIHRDRDRS